MVQFKIPTIITCRCLFNNVATGFNFMSNLSYSIYNNFFLVSRTKTHVSEWQQNLWRVFKGVDAYRQITWCAPITLPLPLSPNGEWKRQFDGDEWSLSGVNTGCNPAYYFMRKWRIGRRWKLIWIGLPPFSVMNWPKRHNGKIMDFKSYQEWGCEDILCWV